MTKYTRAGDILQRAAAAGFPSVVCRGRSWDNESAWVRLLSDAFPVELNEIARQLAAVEERQARTEDFSREYDERRDRLRQAGREAQAAALRDLLGE